jgi:mRNA-degrading endonuclease RelE of RelBE toxin-antitoxin system
MSFQVKITLYASNAGKKLPPEIRKAAKSALKILAADPYIGKQLQADLSGFWTFRFQRYRIVYQIDTQMKTLVVWAIGHRRDIYETFSEYVIGKNGTDPI